MSVSTVRLLIADTSGTPLFTDEQIETFLALEGGVKRAAAAALETIATSEALVSKKIRDQDLSTDGPAVAAELRARAQQLRQQAADDGEGDESGGLTVVEMDPYLDRYPYCW